MIGRCRRPSDARIDSRSRQPAAASAIQRSRIPPPVDPDAGARPRHDSPASRSPDTRRHRGRRLAVWGKLDRRQSPPRAGTRSVRSWSPPRPAHVRVGRTAWISVHDGLVIADVQRSARQPAQRHSAYRLRQVRRGGFGIRRCVLPVRRLASPPDGRGGRGLDRSVPGHRSRGRLVRAPRSPRSSRRNNHQLLSYCGCS